jgi:hypothetical protein
MTFKCKVCITFFERGRDSIQCLVRPGVNFVHERGASPISVFGFAFLRQHDLGLTRIATRLVWANQI